MEGFRSNDTSATHPKNYSNKSETLSPIHEESVDTKKKKSYSFFWFSFFSNCFIVNFQCHRLKQDLQIVITTVFIASLALLSTNLTELRKL